METKNSQAFWWLKGGNKKCLIDDSNKNATQSDVPKLDLDVSLSLEEYLEKEKNALNSSENDVDVGSIIEEINRVAAQSPLGPYNTVSGERSIEDIMREAERIYLESSKNFEQLSQRSRTSQNITELNSKMSKSSTPTPKSLSPLPIDNSQSDTYSEDFSADEANSSKNLPVLPSPQKETQEDTGDFAGAVKQAVVSIGEPVIINAEVEEYKEKIHLQDEIIRNLEQTNKQLTLDIDDIREEFKKTTIRLEQAQSACRAKSISSPEVNLQLEKALENFKDSQEVNTALQLQLDTINKTHCLLKNSYDDLLSSNKNLERRVVELDSTLSKYKTELLNLQNHKDKLIENETNLNKLLEIEKLQTKSLKLQNEKDAKCIQDLNRQIKEMERIIARKHPDSVSALIVAAKNDVSESNFTARKILEDRIRILEEEATSRDSQSAKIFFDIQEKFGQMKLKYESHIEDLELHVNDLKTQMKKKIDTYDMYTQTNKNCQEIKIPQKDTFTVGTQTDQKQVKRAEVKEDAHLVATIRGLQADLSNKEKVMTKLQRELDELRKTNRKLQKEREGSLRSLNEKREFRSFPEKLSSHVKSPVEEEEIKFLRAERDKMKQQLCRIEEDYQALKLKRLHDLNILQGAHEREMAASVSEVNTLKEQLERQQNTLSTLQTELATAKEELMRSNVERDHLTSRLDQKGLMENTETIQLLQKKIDFLEKRYEEREYRLRAIVHGLAWRNGTNRSCEQCADRQKQLIEYKMELDELLATLKALK